MPFTIIRQDIIKMDVDAVVNAANTDLQMGGGVCGAIFKAAGAAKLQAVCDKAAPIKTGGAAITPGFALKAKYIIHAAGPVYSHWSPEQAERLLKSAYEESLRLAVGHGCESIAFPLISSGIYGYPKAEALRAATQAITDFLAEHDDLNVYLAVFDREAFDASKTLIGDVASYIDEHYISEHRVSRRELLDTELLAEKSAADICDSEACYNSLPIAAEYFAQPKSASLDEIIGHMDEPFSVALGKLIDSRGKKDPEVYKKANIDRKLFSKIRSIKGYTPQKPTILALAIALELSLDETDALLERAGYALSHANKFDVIVEYFIINHKYNIYEINEVLFQYDQPQLGG